MKLTKKQKSDLRSSVESMVTGLVESLMSDTSDNFFRDEALDTLNEDLFTDDEVDELREMWGDEDKEGEVDTERFVKEVVDGIMKKFE